MTKAFTLAEIIIVIVILGVVATLAIPRMLGNTEQARASEAFSALESLHMAEKRYELEHGTGVFAACANLDIDFTAAPPKNFGLPVCSAATGSVQMTKNGNAYTITDTIAGVFSCAGTCTGLKVPN